VLLEGRADAVLAASIFISANTPWGCEEISGWEDTGPAVNGPGSVAIRILWAPI
jgi:hypothetical protein